MEDAAILRFEKNKGSQAGSELLLIVEDFLKDRIGAHDLGHIQRVRSIALEIAQTENADLEIVEAMALLHDLVRYEDEREETSVEETLGKAKEILIQLGYSKEKIERILDGIASHSLHSKLHKEPSTIEAKILFDADKLDSVGPIGIARWFTTMAHRNMPIKKSAEIYLATIEEQEKKLNGKLYTKTAGKKIRKKLEYTKKFMKELVREI